MAEERPRYSWTEDRARNVQSNNQRCQDVPPSLAQLSSIVLGLECFKFNSQNRSTVSTGFNNKKMGLCYSKIEERRRNGKKEECMNNCKIGNFETDPVTLARRQKQIDYGKNTPEYAAYLEQVPKESRLQSQPKTPDKSTKCSRRSFDGQVKLWRLLLHAYEPKK